MFNVPSFFGFKSGTAEPFEFTINTANTSTGSSSSDQFKLPLTTSTGLNCTVYWGDGTYDNITNHLAPEVTHTYASSGVYTVKITGAFLGWQFDNGGDKLKMLNVFNWGDLTIDTNFGFFGCTNLTCSATDAPTITTTDLFAYFANCPNFNGAIGNWDVSNVNNMIAMFQGATAFNKDIGAWSVGSVTGMIAMFQDATSFNQDIGAWSVGSVTSMERMFQSATAFNQDIGNWNVSNVTDFTNFMQGKTAANYSATNLDSIYNGWSSRPVQPNESISFGTIKYTAAGVAGKATLTGAPNNWTIVDGGI